MTQRQSLLAMGLAFLILIAGLAAAAFFFAAPYYKKAKADQVELGYWDYVRLGRERMTHPLYRMGPMIELQCEVTADFIINRGEERRILALAAKLKRHPEKVHEHRLINCVEWDNWKKIAS